MKPKEFKAWRMKNGYSQTRLANILGVSPLTVARWEWGAYRPLWAVERNGG